MLALFSVICLGAVALFAFFAVLGEVSPGDLLWLTIVLAGLLVVAASHAWLVRRNLHTHEHQVFFRSQPTPRAARVLIAPLRAAELASRRRWGPHGRLHA